jgi:hypothetical protein
MERKIFLTILGITLIALALAILLPGGRSVDPNPKLPWLIEVDDNGRTSVFGITLGKSTLQQVRDNFHEQGEVSLFVSADKNLVVEAYFQRLFLNGIKADMVLILQLDQATLGQMYDRGLRISKLESGAKKVKLTQPDMLRVAQAPIDHITYIPTADLDAELLAGRFGQPALRITEASGIEHWLYPDKGLDIALNPDGKEVFQYLLPANFDRILKPLQAQEKK